LHSGLVFVRMLVVQLSPQWFHTVNIKNSLHYSRAYLSTTWGLASDSVLLPLSSLGVLAPPAVSGFDIITLSLLRHSPANLTSYTHERILTGAATATM